jgi:hypothetical protein
MTARFERFDPRPGGSYRVVLIYDDPSGTPGKTTADADVVEAQYVDIVPDVRVVQAVDFVSEHPASTGTMRMTWEVNAVDGGTRVTVTADDVPDSWFGNARNYSIRTVSPGLRIERDNSVGFDDDTIHFRAKMRVDADSLDLAAGATIVRNV